MNPSLIRIAQFLAADVCGCGSNRSAVSPADDTGIQMKASPRRSLLLCVRIIADRINREATYKCAGENEEISRFELLDLPHPKRLTNSDAQTYPAADARDQGGRSAASGQILRTLNCWRSLFHLRIGSPAAKGNACKPASRSQCISGFLSRI